MVKMSNSRKRLVPSKVKVKETHISDLGSIDEDNDQHEDLKRMKTGTSRSSTMRNGDGSGKMLDEPIPAPVEWLGYHPVGIKKETLNNNNNYSNGKQDFREQSSPLSFSDRSALNLNNHDGPGQDETSSNGNKEDEEDDDDESEDKIDTHQHDPERLKAFNMFVRLFVDENLDRMVPISKQPKEKIQAIIDSCTRQFPEFAERARKRIRTYLKSCRRNKRSRETGTWESSRPTPAHLTSVQAEQILAQACENESQNAKRMRMGLEPIGQPLPSSGEMRNIDGMNGHGGHNNNNTSSSSNSIHSLNSSPEKGGGGGGKNSSSAISNNTVTPAVISSASDSVHNHRGDRENHNHNNNNNSSNSTANNSSSGGGSNANNSHTTHNSNNVSDGLISSIAAVAANTKSSSGSITAANLSSLVDYRALNGNGVMPTLSSMYRPNFGQAFQRPPFAFPAVAAGATFPHNASSSLPLSSSDSGQPTDLSMKSKPLLALSKLNASEITTVRQLVTGYRESAAFLLRSADELEQLLIQQQ